MKPPIIINESSRIDLSGDVGFYASVEAAQLDLEPIDVDNDEYFAFDSEGRRLRLSTDGRFVRIADGERNPKHQAILKIILADYFRRAGLEQRQYQGASLDELISIGVQKFGAQSTK